MCSCACTHTHYNHKREVRDYIHSKDCMRQSGTGTVQSERTAIMNVQKYLIVYKTREMFSLGAEVD